MKFNQQVYDLAQDGEFYIKNSENGKWKLFIYPVIFGFRIYISSVNNFDFAFVNLCAGANQDNVEELYALTEKILSKVDENATSQQIYNEFPIWDRRPVVNDEIFMNDMRSRAGNIEDFLDENFPSMSSIRTKLNNHLINYLNHDTVKS